MKKETKAGIVLGASMVGSVCLGGSIGHVVGTYAKNFGSNMGEKIMLSTGGLILAAPAIVWYAKKAADYVCTILYDEPYFGRLNDLEKDKDKT